MVLETDNDENNRSGATRVMYRVSRCRYHIASKRKQVIPDLKAMIDTVIHLVAGYSTGQAGLFVFIIALTQERLQKTELLLSKFLSGGRPAEAAHPQQ